MIPLCWNVGKVANVQNLFSPAEGALLHSLHIALSRMHGGLVCSHGDRRMSVESRILYVGMKESVLLFWDVVTRQSAFLPLSSFNTDLDTNCPLLAKGKNAKAD